MGENGEKTVPISATIYESQFNEVVMIANKFYHGNRSRALQMMIEFFISNHDPGTLRQQPSEEIENLIDGFEREQVTPQEFREQILILAGGK